MRADISTGTIRYSLDSVEYQLIGTDGDSIRHYELICTLDGKDCECLMADEERGEVLVYTDVRAGTTEIRKGKVVVYYINITDPDNTPYRLNDLQRVAL